MNDSLVEIAYILDRSGSMRAMQEAAITAFNDFVSLRWTPKFGPVAESSEFREGAGLEQQPRHPNTQ